MSNSKNKNFKILKSLSYIERLHPDIAEVVRQEYDRQDVPHDQPIMSIHWRKATMFSGELWSTLNSITRQTGDEKSVNRHSEKIYDQYSAMLCDALPGGKLPGFIVFSCDEHYYDYWKFRKESFHRPDGGPGQSTYGDDQAINLLLS